MNKTIIWFIVGIIIGLIVGGLAGYFYVDKSPRGNFGKFNNMQISEESKSEVTSFFESNPDQATLNSYCQENSNPCRYYCIEINQDNELCTRFFNMSGGGMPQRR